MPFLPTGPSCQYQLLHLFVLYVVLFIIIVIENLLGQFFNFAADQMEYLSRFTIIGLLRSRAPPVLSCTITAEGPSLFPLIAFVVVVVENFVA
jgi:hypothetical protein